MNDPQDMLGVVLEQGAHLSDALWRVESAGLGRVDAPGGLVVCGMGGSAVGADLAAAAVGRRAERPIRTVRGYRLEPWVGEETLVLLSSYSGNTEETMSCFEAAGAAGAPRIALTTGGKLAERAREEGVPVIGVPGGIQPRAAVAYMVVGALECAALCGAAPPLREEVEATAAFLGGIAADDPEPVGAARVLHGRIPVFYGGGLTAPAALRWKAQVNENAKRPAFWSVLPEADHNEVCGFEAGGDLACVFLEDAGQHERTRRRMELTAELAAGAGLPVVRVASRGESPLERLMSLVLLGDLMSLHLAAIDGTDPTPVDAIERLKQALGAPSEP